MYKLVCMLRVKDGMLFLNQWLENIGPLVDEIVVVDNGSSDGTYEILSGHSKVVTLIRTEGFHEGRDKNLVYQEARKRKPDWILWLDVDEFFESKMTREILNKMMASKIYHQYFFRRFHFHIDDKHYEASFKKLCEISMPDRVLWREQPSGFFSEAKIHNGLIQGIQGRKALSWIRIKHFGAMNREYLHKKTENYIKVDPKNRSLYIKNRDQKVCTWRWYENSEKPILVLLINLMLYVLTIISYIKKKY